MTPLNSLTNGSLGGNFDEMSRAPLSFLISIPRYMAKKYGLLRDNSTKTSYIIVYYGNKFLVTIKM